MTRYLPIPLMLGTAFLLVAADGPTAPMPTAQPHPLEPKPGIATPTAIAAAHSLSKRRAWSPMLAHVAAANRASTLEPDRQGFMNASQVYPYAEGEIYRVYAAPGLVTDIALQPGEALAAVAAGDTVRWVIGDTTSGTGDTKRTHVLIKPFASGLNTNVVITTDRRSYHLSLISTPATGMSALSWTYPQDALIALKREQATAEATAPVAQGLSVEQLSFGYTISGDTPAWRPLRAFDDGRQTFIEFPASLGVGEAPPLFVLGPKKTAELVNYRVKGRFYIVDRLFGAAELRLGTRHQDVVRITRGTDAAAGNHVRRAS